MVAVVLGNLVQVQIELEKECVARCTAIAVRAAVWLRQAAVKGIRVLPPRGTTQNGTTSGPAAIAAHGAVESAIVVKVESSSDEETRVVKPKKKAQKATSKLAQARVKVSAAQALDEGW